jgi:hypothetical protein
MILRIRQLALTQLKGFLMANPIYAFTSCKTPLLNFDAAGEWPVAWRHVKPAEAHPPQHGVWLAMLGDGAVEPSLKPFAGWVEARYGQRHVFRWRHNHPPR